MNAITLVIVLALLAIANAGPVNKQLGRLPMPLQLQEKWGHLMTDDPPEVRSRIVGGTTVQDGERPYQVAMLTNNGTNLRCGGSIISRYTILSAAHCVVGISPSSITLRLNSLTYGSGGTNAEVSAIVAHPQYNANTIDYDYAVLQLATAFSPGTNAAIITLAAAGSDPAAGMTLTVSGWGRVVAGGAISEVLLRANLDVVGRSECQTRWGSNSITARMVCAHSTSQSACNGDSGGPLTDGGVQVGVVSWGSSQCLHQTLPNVYAQVGNIREWIDANTIP